MQYDLAPHLCAAPQVGVTKANELSRLHSLPLIHVHHMEAHAFVARLGSGLSPTSASLPVACSSTASHPLASVHTPTESTASHNIPGSNSPTSSEYRSGHSTHHDGSSSSSNSSCNPPASSSPHTSAVDNVQPQTAVPGSTIDQSSSSTDSSRRGQSARSEEHTEQEGAQSGKHNTDFSSILLQPAVPFPFLCLLVSGGHNLLVLVTGVGQYVQLGTTLDDALGESWTRMYRKVVGHTMSVASKHALLVEYWIQSSCMHHIQLECRPHSPPS